MAKLNAYSTLDEIRERKADLSEALGKDTTKIQELWGKVFVKREETSKGDFIASMISNGVMAVDAFLLYRKLRKNYQALFGRKKSKKR